MTTNGCYTVCARSEQKAKMAKNEKVPNLSNRPGGQNRDGTAITRRVRQTDVLRVKMTEYQSEDTALVNTACEWNIRVIGSCSEAMLKYDRRVER